ncbi:MAG: hypothetical protein ABIH78_03610 [Candidatus Peregrinibacteria bacterium]
MEIRTIKPDKQSVSLLNKITAILFGVFIASMIFAFGIKLFDEIGVYISLAVCAVISFLGFYYAKKSTTLRTVTWGILATAVIGIIGYFIGLAILENILKEAIG